MLNKVLFKWIKWLFFLLVIIFLGHYLTKSYQDLRNVNFEFQPLVLLLSMVFFMIYKIFLSLIWHLITIKTEVNIPLEKAMISWYYSLLGKYIPGKFFLLGGRIYFYQLEGKSQKTIALCFLIENISTLLGAAFLFLLSLPFIGIPFFREYQFAIMAFIAVLLVLIHPRILKFIVNMIFNLFKKKSIHFNIEYKDILQLVAASIANWCVVGIGFFLLVNSVYPLGIEYIFYVAGTFGLSVIIGILSFFAPSGIGVREGIMIFALQFIMPEGAAIVISLLSRFWTVIPELFIIAVVCIYAKVRNINFDVTVGS